VLCMSARAVRMPTPRRRHKQTPRQKVQYERRAEGDRAREPIATGARIGALPIRKGRGTTVTEDLSMIYAMTQATQLRCMSLEWRFCFLWEPCQVAAAATNMDATSIRLKPPVEAGRPQGRGLLPSRKERPGLNGRRSSIGRPLTQSTAALKPMGR